MHRAVHLATEVFPSLVDRILMTTFTRNLAADIRDNLARLAGPETLRRIDVVHIDKLTSDLLSRAGYDYDIAWWGSSSALEDAWADALSLHATAELPEAFYRDEWELVAQPHGCSSWQDYRSASRAGRGVRISRAQRAAIWRVFEEYRDRLDRAKLREPEDALRDAALLLEQGKVRSNWRSAVVDEAQDMSTAAFRMLRAMLGEERPNDLFIVGDGHQRIYRRRVVLKHAGVHVVGRSFRLRVNYRTTDEIRRRAQAVLAGVEVDDLDDGKDTLRGARSLLHGPAPEVRVRDTLKAEVDTIVEWLEGTALERACLG